MTKRFRAIVLCSLIGLTSSCATLNKQVRTEDPVRIPFHYVDQTFIAVPVTVDGSLTRDFILDTGIGVNLISKSICERVACKIAGRHVGKRMSGQEITIPLSSVDSLALSGLKGSRTQVGIFDIDGMMPGTNVGGFLSLGFFRDQPFTVDYKHQVISMETEESLRKIREDGVVVPIRLDEQGPALGAFLMLALPTGQQLSVEVDTGSQALILDEKFMRALDVSPLDTNMKRKEGMDETGHTYVRYFTKIQGSVHLPQNTKFKDDSPEVMFQKIIYDGLVGHNFLRNFTVTYDLPSSVMIFRKEGARL